HRDENPSRPERGGPAPLPHRTTAARRRAEPEDLPGAGDAASAGGPAKTPGAPALPRRTGTAPGGPARTALPGATDPGEGALPRRVRQASLAHQLRQDPERRSGRAQAPADRDADEVRSRMASLQRGWQRGREENATGDTARDGTAQGTTKGDGR
ncbi:histidine kinase, partial [Streptomyces misionensis]